MKTKQLAALLYSCSSFLALSLCFGVVNAFLCLVVGITVIKILISVLRGGGGHGGNSHGSR